MCGMLYKHDQRKWIRSGEHRFIRILLKSIVDQLNINVYKCDVVSTNIEK